MLRDSLDLRLGLRLLFMFSGLKSILLVLGCVFDSGDVCFVSVVGLPLYHNV